MTDLLVIGPHPDDVEISCGGLVIKMVTLGYRVGIVDLTRGETGTRGTPEQRASEAAEAAAILGAQFRENLGLPDGRLSSTEEARRKLIEAIRRYRPAVIVGPYPVDAHPDHAAAGRLLEEVSFLSGLARYAADGRPHRPDQLWSYMCHDPFRPSFILDISDEYARKLDALRCFRSQLHQAGSAEPATDIASVDYLERLDARFRYFGSLVHAKYGEPFHTRIPLRLDDPLQSFAKNRRRP